MVSRGDGRSAGLRKVLAVKGARGVAVLDVARRRVVDQAGEAIPALHLPARREAMCRSLEAQREAALLLGGDAAEECVLVLGDSYLLLRALASDRGSFLCAWLDAAQGNLGLALRAVVEAAALVAGASPR